MLARPGQHFIVRFQPVGAAAADGTIVISTKDTEIISGAYLSLTTAGSTTSVIDTKLSNVNTYVGRTIEFTSNANATSLPNVGLRRILTTYTVASQTMGFTALPANAQVGDRYKILSPVPKGCTKVAICNIGAKIAGATTRIGAPVSFTCADGYQYHCLLADAGNAVQPSFPIPVEFDLGAHGDLTVLIDSTGNWAANTEIALHFIAY